MLRYCRTEAWHTHTEDSEVPFRSFSTRSAFELRLAQHGMSRRIRIGQYVDAKALSIVQHGKSYEKITSNASTDDGDTERYEEDLVAPYRASRSKRTNPYSLSVPGSA
eukprot:3320552-Rhodomonas_salina.4